MAGIPFQVLKTPETGILSPPYFHKKINLGNLLLAEIHVVFSRIPKNTSISIFEVTEWKEKTCGSVRVTSINLCHWVSSHKERALTIPY